MGLVMMEVFSSEYLLLILWAGNQGTVTSLKLDGDAGLL